MHARQSQSSCEASGRSHHGRNAGLEIRRSASASILRPQASITPTYGVSIRITIYTIQRSFPVAIRPFPVLELFADSVLCQASKRSYVATTRSAMSRQITRMGRTLCDYTCVGSPLGVLSLSSLHFLNVALSSEGLQALGSVLIRSVGQPMP